MRFVFTETNGVSAFPLDRQNETLESTDMNSQTQSMILFMVPIVFAFALATALVAFGRDRALLRWATGFGFHALAYTFFSLRGEINDFVSIVLANVAFASSMALFMEGLAEFLDSHRPRWMIWLPICMVAVMSSLLIEPHSSRLRLTLLCATYAFQTLFMLIALIYKRRQTIGRSQYLVAAGAAMGFVMFTTVAMASAAGKLSTSPFSATGLAGTFMLLLASLTVTLLAFGAISMVAEKAEEKLRQGQLHSRGILDSMPSQIAVVDRDGVIVDVNLAWREFSLENSLQAGQPAPHTDVGTNYLNICSASGVEDSHEPSQASEGVRAVIDGRLKTFSLEYPCHSPLEQRWFRMTVTPFMAQKNGAVVAHHNITESKLASEQLRRTEALFRESIDTLNASFVIYDPHDRLVLCNRIFRNFQPKMRWGSQVENDSDGSDLLGRTFEEILRMRLAHGQYPVPAGQEEQWIAERLLERQQGMQLVVREFGKGQWVKITDQRTPSGYLVGLRVDVTELHQAKQAAETARQQLEEKHRELERIARYDSLTKLPNRALLGERLEQALHQTLRRGQHLAVVFIDLDGFKAVNDTHGHEAGDHLLITLAERMKGALRDGDILARLGGDEFVAVLLDLADVDASAPMLNRLLDAAARPFQYGQARLQVSASLGVTFYPHAQGQEQELEPDQLLRQADQAMYQAKQSGKNRFHVFDAEQDRNVRARHENLQNIERALSGGEFVLEYQPKVNLRTGEVFGVEALIRWRHQQKGLLAPADFLPMIEDHPLAVSLGQWVIQSALAQMEHWQELGLNMPISVNISKRHFMQTDFVQRLREALAAHPGLQPNCLELELLEINAIHDLDHVSRVIQECRSISVECALDDFGSGYSSLTGLKKLPVTCLKIDQNFVRDMLDSSDNLLILIGVLKLARAFDLKVIAEGVETPQHGFMLLQLGCELAQGYCIARPMPAAELPAWVKRWKPDPTWSDVALLPS